MADDVETVKTIVGFVPAAWGGVSTLMAGIIAYGWREYRKFKEGQRDERHADVMDEARLGIVDELRAEIRRYVERQEVLTTRVDQMAAERNVARDEKNAALVMSATLKGEWMMKEEIHSREIAQLQLEVEELKSTVRKVVSERDEVRRQYQSLLDARTDPSAPKRRASDSVTISIDNRDHREI